MISSEEIEAWTDCYLESLARKIWLVRKNEIIYQFPAKIAYAKVLYQV
jgi:hypothetical protein